MKKSIKAISIKLFIAIIGIGAFAACSSNPDSMGIEYMPDMYRSPAIEPYVDYGMIRGVEHKGLTKQLSIMQPPLHVVSYHGDVSEDQLFLYLPYTRKASKFAPVIHGLYARNGWLIGDSTSGEYFAAAADTNPIVLTSENVKRIKENAERLYDINCIHCHGEKGDGKGPMVKSGAFLGVPDYRNLTIKEGQVFYSIYYGKGMMGAQSPLVNKKEMWELVHYVEHFRYDNYFKKYMKSDSTSVKSDSTKTQKMTVSDSSKSEKTEG